MAKLERLLNLTAALLETERPLTAEEIRERIEGYPLGDDSFRRAFERDKDQLRGMGIPISLTPVPGTDPPVDGYRIRKADYYLSDPGLEADELAALRLAGSTVRIDGAPVAEGVRKLGGATGDEATEPFASVPDDPRLTPLFSAVTDRNLVAFDYRGERRTLEPWRLDFVRGRWYVTGFDRERMAERHFRLDRIDSDIEVLAFGAFDRTQHASGVRLQPWELGDEAPTRARILVDPDQAAWATNHVAAPAEVRQDGSIVIEVDVTNRDAFRSFVLSFLEHAEILEPPELRAEMIEWLEHLARERS